MARFCSIFATSLIFLASSAVEVFNSYTINFNPISGTTFTAKLDFQIPKIIIADSQFACTAANSCRLLDTTWQKDKVYGTEYEYRLATIDLGIPDQQSSNIIKTSFTIQHARTSFSLFGIHQAAVYRDAILPQRALRFRTAQKDIVYSRRAQDDVSLDWHEQNQLFYIDSYLTYRNNTKTVIAVANICFHDDTHASESYHFIKGNENYKDDWRRFKRADKGDMREFEAKVTFKSQEKSAFEVPYSLEIFECYDLEPFKSFVTKKNEFCELFLGEFFLQRGSIEFLVSNVNGKLFAYIHAKTADYSRSVMHRWQFFVRLAFWASLAVFAIIVLWDCWKPILRKERVRMVNRFEEPLAQV